MKKRGAFVCFLYLILLISMFNIPGFASTDYTGYAALPSTDPPDDVIKANSIYNPLQGSMTNTHPEVDILLVAADAMNPDLIISFNATPLMTMNYTRMIYIDNNSDGKLDFLIMDVGMVICLVYYVTLLSFLYWNSTSSTWQDLSAGMPELPYAINGNNLSYQTVGIAISNLADAKVGIMSYYIGESPFLYIDLAPGIPATQIPGFAGLAVILSLIGILGLIFLIQKQKFDW